MDCVYLVLIYCHLLCYPYVLGCNISTLVAGNCYTLCAWYWVSKCYSSNTFDVHDLSNDLRDDNILSNTKTLNIINDNRLNIVGNITKVNTVRCSNINRNGNLFY